MGPRIFDFCLKKISLKQSMKIKKIGISGNFRNFKILNFHWLFQRKLFRTKIEKFWSQKNFRRFVFRFFSDENFSDNFFSDYLFRSQMIPGFRKSHLEQHAPIIKIRTTHTKKSWLFFLNIAILGGINFVDPLYSSCSNRNPGMQPLPPSLAGSHHCLLARTALGWGIPGR